MDTNELYINSYLNSMGNTLEFYVEKLMKSKNTDSDYSFCVERIIKMIDNVSSVIRKINVPVKRVNRFYNLLYLLKDYNIPEVNDFLSRDNYLQTFENNYKQLLSLIKANSTLTSENIFMLDFMLGNNIIHEEDKDIVYDFCIKIVLKRSNYLSLKSFKAMMNDYIKKLLKNSNCSCDYFVKRYGSHGHKFWYNECLYFDERKIERMYSRGDYQILLDIFQGVHMAEYAKSMKESNSSDLISIMIKDAIISDNNPDYEKQNMEVMPFYIESEIAAYNSLISYFDKLGLRFYNGMTPYAKHKEELQEKMNLTNRNYNGRNQTIDEMFSNIIESCPEVVYKYPSLVTHYDFITTPLGKD